MPKLSDERYENVKRNEKVMYKALSNPCADCDLRWHPLVMTFDHIDRSTKKYVISSIRAMSPIIFDKEIAKCEVVCNNCHKIREFTRDMDTAPVSHARRNKHSYYRNLVPHLIAGGILEDNAYMVIKPV